MKHTTGRPRFRLASRRFAKILRFVGGMQGRKHIRLDCNYRNFLNGCRDRMHSRFCSYGTNVDMTSILTSNSVSSYPDVHDGFRRNGVCRSSFVRI